MAPSSTRSNNLKYLGSHHKSSQNSNQPAFSPPLPPTTQISQTLTFNDHENSITQRSRLSSHVPTIQFDISPTLSSDQGSPILGFSSSGPWDGEDRTVGYKYLRHGFAEAYQDPNYVKSLPQSWYLYWVESRHKDKKRSKSESLPARPSSRQQKRAPHICPRPHSLSITSRLSTFRPPFSSAINENIIPSIEIFNPSDEPVGPWSPITRSRTVAGCLNLCLRLGFDPPDLIRIPPCATKECWIDPNNFRNKDKALLQIGECLQRQYENLSLGTAATSAASANQSANGERVGETTNSQIRGGRWKLGLDPPIELVQKICLHLRRAAKNERVLFHYNGHGVPKPSSNGDIWFFNSSYTQYIPTNISDLLDMCGSPMVYVWDCSSAGSVVAKVEETAKRKDKELELTNKNGGYPLDGSSARTEENTSLRNNVPFYPTLLQLGACAVDETLPQHAELPADILTSCLTSPIDIALRYFWIMNPSQRYGLTIDEVNLIEGKLNDRRTPLGELNWVFNAVADTIAWNCLSNEVFQRLFRYDMMIASLFRGFLLAQRVMKSYDCHPVSTPELPDTSEHPLWKSWDLAVDAALAQVPAMLTREKELKEHLTAKALADSEMMKRSSSDRQVIHVPPMPPPFSYRASDFFSVELTAFEMWLKHASISRSLPSQLPLVLQVLLSQNHRLRALVLLCKFLDLGPRAVEVALGLGIFPYVLKLLQSPAPDLRRVMIYIWARILAVFQDCRDSLMTSHAVPTASGTAQPPQPALPLTYFVSAFLSRSITGQPGPLRQNDTIETENRAMCAFILSVIARGSPRGQLFCMKGHILDGFLEYMLTSRDLVLRQWCTIGLAVLWDGITSAAQDMRMISCFPELRASHITLNSTRNAIDILSHYTVDETPEIRAAAIFAFSTLAGCSASKDPRVRRGRSLTCSQPTGGLTPDDYEQVLFAVITAACATVEDGSAMVRQELVICLSAIADEYRGHLGVAAIEYLEREASLNTVQTDAYREYSTIDGREDGVFSVQEKLFMITEGSISDSRATDIVTRRMIFRVVYECLLILCDDSVPDVADGATLILDCIHKTIVSVIGSMPVTSIDTKDPNNLNFTSKSPQSMFPSGQHASSNQSLPSANGATNGLKSDAKKDRNSSSANGEGRRQPPGRSSPQDVDLDMIKQKFWNEDIVRQRRRRNDQPIPNDPFLDILPLKSQFFETSSQYFRDPQLKAPEVDEEGSNSNSERRWRKRRSKTLVAHTQILTQHRSVQKWDEPVASWRTSSPLQKVLFHQFESIVVSADSKSNVLVHDWKKRKPIAKFSNSCGVIDARVTSLHFVNEDDVTLLLTGAIDGSVRLWRHYEHNQERSLVTGFKALQSQTPTTSMNSGMVTEWQQSRGHLLAGGNSRYIRIWDATRELTVREIKTSSDSCITSITSDQTAGDVIVAGFGDGTIRVYDKRRREENVQEYLIPHKNWVQNVKLQRGGTRELASTALFGEVCLWDLRISRNPFSTFIPHSEGVTTSALHDHTPLLITGSRRQAIKVWDLYTLDTELVEPVNEFKVGLTSSTAIESLAFHPQRLMFGVYSGDALQVYCCDKEQV